MIEVSVSNKNASGNIYSQAEEKVNREENIWQYLKT
jgi:hypothetical protein